jgi:hypothetical protein
MPGETNMVAPEAPEEMETPQVVNLSQTSVEKVEAELVRASLTGIEYLTAEEAELQESAAGAVNTEKLTARDSIIGFVNTGSASIEDCITVAVRAEDNISFNGVAGVVVGGTVQVEELDAVLVVGREVNGANIRSGLLISREVHGNVETLMDSRTALLAGLAGGISAGLVLLVGRLLFRRKG